MAQRFAQIWLAQPALERAQVESLVAEDIESGLFGTLPARAPRQPTPALQGLQDTDSLPYILSSVGSVIQQRLLQQSAAPRQVPWGSERAAPCPATPAMPLSPQLAADASAMFPRTPALSAFRTEPRVVLHPDISRGAESRPIPAVVPQSVLQGTKVDIARAARHNDPRTASIAVAAVAQQCSVRNYAPPEVALMSTLVGYNVNAPTGQGLLYGVTNEMHSEGILAVPSADVIAPGEQERMAQATMNDVLRTCLDQETARDSAPVDVMALMLPQPVKGSRPKKRSRSTGADVPQSSKIPRACASADAPDPSMRPGEVLSAPQFQPEMVARDVTLEDVWRWLDPGLEYITEYKFVPQDMNHDSVVYGVTACVCDTAVHYDFADAAGCDALDHPIRQKLTKGTADVQIGGSTMTSFVASMHPQRAQELLLPMSDSFYHERTHSDKAPTLAAGAGVSLEYDNADKVITQVKATEQQQVPPQAERMCDRCVCAGQQAHCDVAGAPCDVGYACGPACKCHMHCRGEGVSKVHLPLQVVYTGPGKGWGVWCTQDIPAGTVICKYVGEVITGLEAERRVHKGATLADGLPGDAYMYELKFRAPRMDDVQLALEEAISRGASSGSMQQADLKLIAASSAMFSESLPFLDSQFANPVFYNESLTKEQQASISMALTPTTLPIFEAFGLASCSSPSSTPSSASDTTSAAGPTPPRGGRRSALPLRKAAAGVSAAISACSVSPRRPLASSAPAAAIPPVGRRCALTGVPMSDAVDTLRELQRMYPPAAGKGFVLQNDFAVNELVESGGRAGAMLPLFMRYGDLLQSNNGPMAPQNVFRGTLLNETLSTSERKRYHEQRFFVVDSRTKGNVARFINHSCDPNCETIVISRHPDPLLHDVTVRAVRDIPAYTELSYDYQYEVNMNPHRKLVCHCGAANCKGRLL